MKLILENWQKYLNENIFFISIDKILPTEEMGHGKPHDCPGETCEREIEKKIILIKKGNFEPLRVCNKKPIVTARLQGDKNYTAPADKKGSFEEPFFYILDGHHRLEAAKRLGMRKVPATQDEE